MWYGYRERRITMEWTETGCKSILCLEAEMKTAGFGHGFPDERMIKTEHYIYGTSRCLVCKNGVTLRPYWNGKTYRLYLVCGSCGKVRRI